MHPYIADLGDRDPLVILAETPQRLQELVKTLGDSVYTRTYEPGKWTVQQIIAHLLHAEIAFNFRIRQALAVENYIAQSFDQDDWMTSEAETDGATSLVAYSGLRQFNLALYRSLNDTGRARPFIHPDLGEMNVGLILQLMAGHELRHLSQLAQLTA